MKVNKQTEAAITESGCTHGVFAVDRHLQWADHSHIRSVSDDPVDLTCGHIRVSEWGDEDSHVTIAKRSIEHFAGCWGHRVDWDIVLYGDDTCVLLLNGVNDKWLRKFKFECSTESVPRFKRHVVRVFSVVGYPPISCRDEWASMAKVVISQYARMWGIEVADALSEIGDGEFSNAHGDGG